MKIVLLYHKKRTNGNLVRLRYLHLCRERKIALCGCATMKRFSGEFLPLYGFTTV